MTGSLARTVQRTTLAAWLAATAAVGAGTALFLHVEGRASTDRALLAAATAHAGPARRAAEDLAPGVEVRGVGPHELPEAWAREATRGGASWHTTGTERVLVLRAGEDDDEEDDDHRPAFVVARAPRPTLARTAGPFVVGFVGVAGLVTAVAAVVLRALLGRAVEPLSRASDRVSRVVGAGAGARVEEDGPDEIRGLLASVNALLGRLDDAFHAQARFTADAAHELRTPVAAMIGELEVALRRPRSGEERAATLARALTAAERLGELVEGLLLLARVDAGQAEQGRAREHAGHLAMLAAERERAGVEAGGGTLAVDVRADPEIDVHEALWVAAVANLLRNAAVHAPGAPVALRVEADGGTARFVVEDGGPGIPPERTATVFDRTARRSATGLGLGLPLAREIARRHGGDCRIETPNRVVLVAPIDELPGGQPR